METAISIAYSCHLFTDDMGIIEMREDEFTASQDDAAVVQVSPQESVYKGSIKGPA